MNIGMFYLLPLLAIPQIATSTPYSQVEENNRNTIVVDERANRLPKVGIRSPKRVPSVAVNRPIGRNVIRAGRNIRKLGDTRVFIPRN